MTSYDFRLAGQHVDDAHLEYFQVVVTTDGGALFRIEGRCVLWVGETSYEIDPGESTSGVHVGRLAELVGTTLASARAADDGTLTLDGAAGSDARALVVPADPYYEAWNAGIHRSLVVCVPGGELAIWDPPGTP